MIVLRTLTLISLLIIMLSVHGHHFDGKIKQENTRNTLEDMHPSANEGYDLYPKGIHEGLNRVRDRRSIVATYSALSNIIPLTQYGIITLGNLSTNSEVHLSTLVCGSYVSQQSTTLGSQNNHHQSNSRKPSLEVARSIVAGNPLNVRFGSVLLGDLKNRITKIRSNQFILQNRRLINVNDRRSGANVRHDPNLLNRCSLLTKQLLGLSRFLVALSPNNQIFIPTHRPGVAKLVVKTKNKQDISIFNIHNGDSLFHNPNVQQIEIEDSKVNPALIVINVGGKSVKFDRGNMVGLLTQSKMHSRIIFNFYQAHIINIDRCLYGSILAPYATLYTTSSIDGSVAVYNIRANAPIHRPLLKLDSLEQPMTKTRPITRKRPIPKTQPTTRKRPIPKTQPTTRKRPIPKTQPITIKSPKQTAAAITDPSFWIGDDVEKYSQLWGIFDEDDYVNEFSNNSDLRRSWLI